VDADREAAEAFGAEAACVVTAWTVQAAGRVERIEPVPPEEWSVTARVALAAQPVGAIKTGLLPGAAAVAAAVALVADAAVPVVVDPVLAASGGERFLDDAGIAVLLEELLARGPIVTPNLPELARLSGASLGRLAADPEVRVEAAGRLLERGASACVVKGGHGGEDPVRDLVLVRGAAPRWCEHPRVPGGELHGSGCRFASAVAAQLAGGVELAKAVARAGAWIADLLR